MRLDYLAQCLGLDCRSDVSIDGVTIDSRRPCQGKLFVAFKGQQVDGHDYALAAVKNGAVAVLAERPLPGIDVPVFVVKDVFQALTQLARTYYQELAITTLALTGSNGKTTVKEMLKSIFLDDAFVSYGNFNNHLGVPINMLSVAEHVPYAIFELGANHKGDIAYTAALIQPDIALINNIGPAHIGEFGGMTEVADAKAEIYAALSSDGIAIINADDAYHEHWDTVLHQQKRLYFSSEHQADVYAQNIRSAPDGTYQFDVHIHEQKMEIVLQVPGRHQVQNALAAAAMAHAAGVSMQRIQQGLNAFTGVAGRLRCLYASCGAKVIDDSYNANLASVKVALHVLAAASGVKIFILGDLGELGPFAEAHHREIGEIARSLGVDSVFTVGQYAALATQAFGQGAKHFASQEALLSYLEPLLNKNMNILIKGSRSAKMDLIVQHLCH